jgi:hypothetical protein
MGRLVTKKKNFELVGSTSQYWQGKSTMIIIDIQIIW